MVTTTSPPKLTPTEWNLFELARSNRIDGLKRVIDNRKTNLNVRDKFDRTPLHFAASEGNLAAVRLLLEGHAVVDVYDKFGITPLLWAVYNNHKNVVQFLLEKGAKHNKVSKQGHTIIHFIAESNALGVLKHLYQKYRTLKIDEQDKAGLTPFLVAAGRGNQTLMEVFARQKCNVLATDKDYDQKSPLHYAAFANHQEIIRTLLAAGCNPNIDSETHDCPLIAVSRKGFHSCIDTLMTYGADKDKRTKVDNSALHVACLANLPETVQFLAWRGFDLLARNKRGQTSLHISVEQNKIETVELLILIGAPLNVKDDVNNTPLEVAAKASHTALVDLIIKAERWHQKCPVSGKWNLISVPTSFPLLKQHRHFVKISEPGKFAGFASHLQLTTNVHQEGTSVTTSFIAYMKQGIRMWESVLVRRPSKLRDDSVESEEVRYQMMNTTAQMNEGADTPSGIPQSQSFLGLSGREFCYTPRGTSYTTYDSPGQGHRSANYVLSGVPSAPSSRTLEPVSENAEFVDHYQHVFINGSRHAMSPSVSGSLRHQRRTDDDSTIGSDSLSLGYEASRGWMLGAEGSGTGQNSRHHNQSKFNGEVASIRSSGDDRPSVASSRLGYRPGKRPTTRHLLSNGETMIRLGETYVSSTDGTTQVPKSNTLVENATGNFSLLHYKHPYAEEMKVMLFGLAHNDLKPGDWKKLARLWEFTNEHVDAIESQDTGKSSYKEHGYRMFDIWIHGVYKESSPMNDLYQGLVSIHRNKLAHNVRRKLESGSQHKSCSIQ